MPICKTSIFIGLLAIVLFECTSQKKVPLEFPAAMSAPVKQEYVRLSEKGRILYDINCASCHNTKIHGKTIIPDFSPEQLKGYELRISNARHESALPEANVTAEELGLIMTFLNYKKKNQPVEKK